MRKWGPVRLLGLVLLLCPSLAGADEPGETNTRFAAVRALIQEQMAASHLPSMSIAVAEHGEIVWEESFGWADVERRVPATPDTMYGVASITKPLTATGLMPLVEAGTIDLDEPVNGYLGSARLTAYAGEVENATVRRIANHTAGVPHHWQFFYEGRSEVAPSTAETLRRYGYIVRPPGEKYEYSNINYAVLEQVIETASGRDYAGYMRDRVFTPLGMTHTAIEPGADLQPFLATGYDQAGTRLPPFRTNYPGGAGAHSSAHDLIRFAMFHLKDHLGDQVPILSDGGIDEMQRPTAQIGPGRAYGVGWRFDTVRGTIEHGGYFPGASAVLRLVPDKDVAIVVLTNISNDDQATALNLVAEATLKVLIPDWPEPQPRAPLSSPPQPFTGSPILAGRWTGFVRTWVSDTPLTLEFLQTGELVTAQLGDQPGTSMGNVRYDPARGLLSGEMRGALDTPDARRAPPFLLKFDLRADEGATMTGTVTAVFEDPTAPRMSHWVRLTRQ